MKINSSKYTVAVILIMIFVVMLVFNFMTPYIADDYGYRYSFADGKLIESIAQIPKSMYMHSTYMNGRVISHGIEQLFLIFPKWVFNVVNGAMFTLMCYLIYIICNQKEGHNGLLLIAVFSAIWVFVPAFGQVFLWQVGSVNYLWAVVFVLLFLLPYVKSESEFMENNMLSGLFCVFSFIVGMYSEIASFVGIMCAMGLVLLKREKITLREILPIAFAAAGFAGLLMMPVELEAKVSEKLSFLVLADNFVTCTKMLEGHLKYLLIAWVCLAVLGVHERRWKCIAFSALLALLGITANYVMIIGTYFAERTMFMAVILFVMAEGVLVSELVEGKFIPFVNCAVCTLAVVFVFSFVCGAYDIACCYGAFCEREAEIERLKSEGERNLELPIVYPKTKHSPFYGVVDINCDSKDMWPNVTMAWYYGVDSIVGIK